MSKLKAINDADLKQLKEKLNKTTLAKMELKYLEVKNKEWYRKNSL